MPLAPILCLTHGGGPMPLLDEPGQASITKSLQTRVAAELESAKPAAIVLVTAHWQTEITTVSTAAKPKLYFDYRGFPKKAYELEYPAPGSPEVAEKVVKLLQGKGLKVETDGTRGWDHGVFVPLMLARPEADIPIVMVSVLSSQSPADLFALGAALAPLRKDNIAVVGSGSPSFHNTPLFFSGLSSDSSFQKQHKQWRAKLSDGVEEPDSTRRLAKLKGWREWDGSETMHPKGKAEHFSPLFVCAGAAGQLGGDRGSVNGWEDEMMGFKMQNWIWTG